MAQASDTIDPRTRALPGFSIRPGLARRTALAIRPTLAAFFLLAVAACGGGDVEPGDGAAADSASGPPAGQEAAPRSAEAAPEGAGEPEQITLVGVGYDSGDARSAAISVVEFSDFGCVFCARFHEDDFHVLHDEFVATGDVIWKYVPITIGGFPNGELAGRTGECAGEQGRFTAIRDLLYEERPVWLATNEYEAPALFRSYARSVGAELTAWEACMTGDAVRERLRSQNEIASRLGVRGTPTFFVETYPVQGAPAIDDFREALRGLVAEARARAEAPPAPDDDDGSGEP